MRNSLKYPISAINYFKTECAGCQRNIFLNSTLYTEVNSCTCIGTSLQWGRCNMTNRLIMTNKFTPVTAHQSNQVLLFTRHDTSWCVRLGILKDNVSDRLHPDATSQNAIFNYLWSNHVEFLLRSLGSGSLLTPLSKHQVFIRILICSVHVILLDGGCF